MEWSRTTAGFLNHIIVYPCLSRGEIQLEATGIWLNSQIVIVHFMPRCDLVIPHIFPVVLLPWSANCTAVLTPLLTSP